MSDSYDPEWGTGSVRMAIEDELSTVYDLVTEILGGAEPINIRILVDSNMGPLINASITEKGWRLIRFALERAKYSL